MLRNGLSYSEASANANRLARNAYCVCRSAGGTNEAAVKLARAAYEKEMRWYESKE